jgi:hypothetical protein
MLSEQHSEIRVNPIGLAKRIALCVNFVVTSTYEISVDGKLQVSANAACELLLKQSFKTVLRLKLGSIC